MLDASNPSSSANDILCRQEALAGWGCQLVVPGLCYPLFAKSQVGKLKVSVRALLMVGRETLYDSLLLRVLWRLSEPAPFQESSDQRWFADNPRAISLGGWNREARKGPSPWEARFFLSWTASQVDDDIASRL